VSDDVPIETRAASGLALAGGNLTLTVLSGSRKGTNVPLHDTIRIGKADDNELVLSDDTVSRHHCELVREGSAVRVRDLGSTNGTRVDGTRVTDALLSPGAVLRVGEVEIALRPTPQKNEVLPSDKSRFGSALGQSLAMRTIFGVLERIAPTEATVLLEGETGTGKDVIARSIVEESPRKNGPFVVVDCGAVAYSLIESELFGHERGAFTGAVSSRQGAFELGSGGTVFLDEIGDLPLDVQPKLLRVLETREFRRVGGNRPIKTDVRVVAATKRDLKREVAGGKFREDLYFRLAVVPLTVPSLRQRREDIPLLAEHILTAACAGGEPISLGEQAMQGLLAHDWPGNVRELRNVLERAVYMARAAGSSELGDVAIHAAPVEGGSAFVFDPQKSYRETRAVFEAELERRYVKWLLGRHNGNISGAARDAKMDRKHLSELAKKHGIKGEE
jgi:DNA-binding NtrC family response regulator